jgi:hypothetical protein
MGAIVTKLGVIGLLGGMIVIGEFCQKSLPKPILLLTIENIPERLFHSHVETFSLAVSLMIKCS